MTITVVDVDEEGELSMLDYPRVGAPLTATLTDVDDGTGNASWDWEKSDDGNAPWTDATDGTVANNIASSSYTPVQADAGSGRWANSCGSRSPMTTRMTPGKTITEQANHAGSGEQCARLRRRHRHPLHTPRTLRQGGTSAAPVTATDSDTSTGTN